ncbi:unnamed protein product, partial [Nesidiocoris tenuis]
MSSREGSVDSEGVGYIMESVGTSTMLLGPPGGSDVSRSPSPFTASTRRRPPPRG